jgi:transcriptional regulator with GAF, ATPase, and Fis domain
MDTRDFEAEEEIRTRAAGGEPGGSARASTIYVTVLTGARKGTTLPLRDRLAVGKAPDNDLVLPDDTVSRHHCELLREPAGISVRDLGSTNGTKVEGARIQAATLPPGTVLRIGEVEVALRVHAPKSEVLPSDKSSFGLALGQSLAMRTIFGVLEKVAPTDATVLLEGETGTGKDVLARSICQMSTRAQKPFVVVDCGAVSYNLLESELFGHERGAFTGAVAARQGAFELADGGTLFLDEIGELPLDVQPKLLRVLETKEFRRVGGNKTLRADVRVIAATKRDVQKEVAAGKFREDLYFRLAVVPVTVPPLRARREDIPMLVRAVLEKGASLDKGASRGSDMPATEAPLTLPEDSMQALMAHDWPGNVRELRNVLERAIYMAHATGGRELNLVSLPVSRSGAETAFQFEAEKSYRETRAHFDAEFERRYVKWILQRHHGNISAAAREARMDRKHLHDMAKKHGLRGEGADDDG